MSVCATPVHKFRGCGCSFVFETGSNKLLAFPKPYSNGAGKLSTRTVKWLVGIQMIGSTLVETFRASVITG